MVDVACHGPADFLQELIQILQGVFGDKFDLPVGLISHEPDHIVPLRDRQCCISKPNSLNVSSVMHFAPLELSIPCHG